MAFLWYIYLSLLAGCLLMALLRWKQLNQALKVIAAILCFSLLAETLRGFVPDKAGKFILHMYILLELILSFFYFYFLLSRNKRVILYAGLAFFYTAIFVLWLVNPGYLWERNYLDCVFLALCVSLWSGTFFAELINKPLQYSLKSDGNFWVNCGNFLFYPGTILLFGFSKYLQEVNPVMSQSLKTLNQALNLILYFLYFIAFCITRKNPDTFEPEAKK